MNAEEFERLRREHEHLCKCVQTGLQLELGTIPDFGNRTQLRCLQRDFASLCQLLMDDQIIQPGSMMVALVAGMREEVDKLEDTLTRLRGRKVTLR